MGPVRYGSRGPSGAEAIEGSDRCRSILGTRIASRCAKPLVSTSRSDRRTTRQHRSVHCEVPTRYTGLLPTAAHSHESIWRSVSEPGVARVGDADSFINIRKCGNVCQRRSKSRPVWRSKTRPGSGATMPAAKIPARYRQRSGVVVGLMRPRSTMNCAPLPRYRHRV